MKDIDKMSDNELRAEVRVLRTVLDAAQVPRHDYCGTDDWFIALDKAVYEATTDVGERYRDKYADSGEVIAAVEKDD